MKNENESENENEYENENENEEYNYNIIIIGKYEEKDNNIEVIESKNKKCFKIFII